MTQHQRQTAGESWRYYRSTFNRRSLSFPALSVLVRIIDRICDLGYSERLYAGASLDSLVISVRPQPRDRRRTILATPKGDAVEFRFYHEEGASEVATVARDRFESALESYLLRLLVNPTTSNSGTVGSESEA